MQHPDLQLQQGVPLAPFTTLHIGGPARFFVEITTEAQLLEALHLARRKQLPIFILGGGSNLLIGDRGFDGLVLHIAIDSPFASTSTSSHIDYTIAAGVDWNAFVLHVCQQGISGIECLAGIPGSVGGTPVQNVGAYGQEVAGTIHTVRALDLETLTFVTLSHHQCAFAYRRSLFNSTHRGRYIVTQVTFRFDPAATPHLTYADLIKHFPGQHPNPLEIYAAVREIRHSKGMLLVPGEADCRSAGSFFKNPIVPDATLTHIAQTLHLDPAAIPHWPVAEPNSTGLIKLPAAWLLERAGFHKGFALGPAGISSRHTLAIINRGAATAADILALRDLIQQKVLDLFAIPLEQEPVQLGL